MLRFLRKKEPPPSGETTCVTFEYDRVLMFVTLALMGIGVIMVYSASIVTAQSDMNNEAHYLEKQLIFVGVSIAFMGLATNLHHGIYKRFVTPISLFGFFLMFLVFAPGIGIEAKGAHRWIGFGPLRYQPSEGLKIAWVVFLAGYLSTRQDRLHRWKDSWLVPCIGLTLVASVLMLQRDFGSTVICVGLMVGLFFAAGALWRHLMGFAAVGAVGLVALILLEPYRIRRLMSFLDPEGNKQGDSWQLYQALISFGSGNWTGLGLGGSHQKLSYLPEAHTDFIFSILGEELGLMGVAAVIILFAIFVWRGFRIARHANTVFGSLLAFGITAVIAGQAIANMLVATGLIPTKGLTLPLISYGGSSLLTTGLAIGILLNISRRQPPPEYLLDWLNDRRRVPVTTREVAA